MRRMAPGAPTRLRTEMRPNPMGIGTPRPRFSWWVTDDRPGARQTAYHVQAAATEADLESSPLWDSGRVESGAQHLIYWGCEPLGSRQQVVWRVRTWDAAGEVSPWSELARFEVGLLYHEDWTAEWIAHPERDTSTSVPCPYVRREFSISGAVKRARLYATARGLMELRLNGRRVGNDELAPGWTDYHRRNQVMTYDVAEYLREGANCFGAMLGDGWYSGYLGFQNNRQVYGKEPSLLAQLEIELETGEKLRVATDRDWRVSTGAILAADLYHGESVDARLEPMGWDQAGFAAEGWRPVAVAARDGALLEPKRMAAVRAIQTLRPRSRTEPAPGVFIFDLGQNMVGRVRLRMRASAGETVVLRHGEMLQDDGSLYTANLRSARCTDTYVARGDAGGETYEPRFTFHGFRYVEVSGLANAPTVEDVTGVVLHNDLEVTGRFETSDPLINQLQSNIVWGQKGNFLEVPTDCPQRDERLGWTGDAQVFIRTACFNMDVAAFFEKWMADVRDAQTPDGVFHHVAPAIGNAWASSAWADAGVICPWTIFRCYGDKEILRENFEAMTRWVDYQHRESKDLVASHTGFGDWLAIDAPDPGRAPTPVRLISTAYFAWTARLLAAAARELGKAAEAQTYERLWERVRETFQNEWVTPNGRVVGNTQTGYLLALAFDLLPEAQRPVALAHLVSDIEGRGWKLSTGFVGTPLLCPVLTRFGRTDVAYRLLHQRAYPSWLYSVDQGATTIWERWNSYTKEGGFGDVGMNSFNHYAYGSVGEWMYATVLGVDLAAESPAFQSFVLRPEPGGELTWVKGSLDAPHGRIEAEWKREGHQVTFRATVPANSVATFRLPAGARECSLGTGSTFPLPAGRHEVTWTSDIGP